MLEVREAVICGNSLSGALRASPYMTDLVVSMAEVGEETGRLDYMFDKLSEYYQDEIERIIQSLLSLIEPIMIIFIGGLIAMIVVAMYLPMFSINPFDGVNLTF